MKQVDSTVVQPAIVAVMGTLPDRNRDPQAVTNAALAAVPEPHRPEVEPIVRRLVKLSPRCWGIHRRRAYWRLVFLFLPAAVVLTCYLRQFPPTLTVDQRRQLKNYLKWVFRLPDGQATAALARFGTRASRRPKPRSCCGWI